MLPLLLSSAAFLAPPSPDVLLARAAELVLRARLSERDEVRVQVSGGSRMLSGGVEAVSVHGTRWCTPLRLSCRRIDLSVGRTDVDLPSLVSRQRIVLRRPAEGSASIFFSARDWDNFLAHPQMAVAVAARRGRSGAPAVAFGSGTELRPGSDGGAVRFPVRWGDEPLVATLSHGADGSARCEVEPAADGVGSAAAAAWLGSFFDELLLDLDGCELGYRELAVRAAAGAASQSELALSLSVCVRRFPSLNINF